MNFSTFNVVIRKVYLWNVDGNLLFKVNHTLAMRYAEKKEMKVGCFLKLLLALLLLVQYLQTEASEQLPQITTS